MKLTPQVVTLCAIAALSLSVSGCLFGNSSGGSSEPGTPPGAAEVIGKYILKDGKLLFPPQERTRYECGPEDGLQAILTTTLEDSGFLDLRRDTLYLGLFHPNHLNSGAVVQMIQGYKRNGSGTGIEGQWNYFEYTFRVLSGDLTAEVQTRFEKMAAEGDTETRFVDFVLVIGNDEMTSYSDYKWAEQFLAVWNGLYEDYAPNVDSAKYSVSVKVVDKHTLELKGEVTAESVRIVFTDDGSRTYTSDLSSHVTHHFDAIPKSCPNDFQPKWYYEFLDGNKKP